MTNNYFGYIIGTLVVLAVVMVVFLLVDRLLKNDGKKAAAETKPADKPVEKPAEKPVTEVKIPTIQIYNSELADDLNEILKHTNSNNDARLNIESRVDRESNISKYIHDKKYESFNFADETESMTQDDEQQPMKFTREDYKKFMALSNIDDKK